MCVAVKALVSLMIGGVSTVVSMASTDGEIGDSTYEFGRAREIFQNAVRSAREDHNINFCGFFLGMSRHDAIALARYYKLKPEEFGYGTVGENAVWALRFSGAGIRRVVGKGDTFEELAQQIANQVGDLEHHRTVHYMRDRFGDTIYKREVGSDEYYQRTTIDGTDVIFGKVVLHIKNRKMCSNNPIETVAAKMERIKVSSDVVPQLLKSMVPIPGKSYKLGQYEITQQQWAHVMHNNPSDRFNGITEHPVDNVSWDDCQDFVKRLNALEEVKRSGMIFRLPTKEEWEYACRAGASAGISRLLDGKEITRDNINEIAWFGLDDSHPIGQKVANAYGLYDMLGNVSEWVQTAKKGKRYILGGSYGDEITSFSKDTHSNAFDGFSKCVDGKYKSYHYGLRLCASTIADVEAARQERNARYEMACQDIVINMVPIPKKSYRMGKYEVTQAQWEAVMDDNPSNVKDPTKPVESISLKDCHEFLRRLNSSLAVKKSGLVFRIPSVEEWEYACLGGLSAKPRKRKSAKPSMRTVEGGFGSGKIRVAVEEDCSDEDSGNGTMIKHCRLLDGEEITDKTLGKAGWVGENSANGSHPVGKKKPNAYGLYDMIGNVSEIACKDKDGDGYVGKGGSYDDSGCYWKVSNSNYFSEDGRNNTGLRLCASAMGGAGGRAVAQLSGLEGGKASQAVESEGVSRLSQKDQKLKGRVEELLRLPPSPSSAGKWFKLAKELESKELQQAAFKAAGAALVCSKRRDIYNSKVRPLIKDVSSFEELILVECPACNGEKTIAKRCSSCAGSGVCKFAKCRDGKRLLLRMTGNEYVDCSACKGTGRCQKCNGEGTVSSRCGSCYGKGMSLGPESAAEAYRSCVEIVSVAFQ